MKTVEPIRVVASGDRLISTIPAASVRGAVARWSQPRSFGLTFSSLSATSATESWRLSMPARTASETGWLMSRRYPAHLRFRTGCAEHHPNGSLPSSTWRTGSVAFEGSSIPVYEARVLRRMPLDQVPKHVGRDARRQPALGQGRRAGHRRGLPGRRRQHPSAARLVRGGRRRGGHPVAAVERQPHQPPAGPARGPARDHRRSRRLARRRGPLAGPPRRCARPPARGDRRAAQGRRGGHPRRRRAARQRRRRVRRPPRDRRRRPLAAPRARRRGHAASRSSPTSSTSSTSRSTSTPRASPTPTW